MVRANGTILESPVARGTRWRLAEGFASACAERGQDARGARRVSLPSLWERVRVRESTAGDGSSGPRLDGWRTRYRVAMVGVCLDGWYWMNKDKPRELIFLGTGTSHGVPVIGCECATCTSDDPRDRRTRCSVLFELPKGRLLVDTPPELRIQLLRERIGRIDAVAFTHEHADHLFGLDDLRIFPKYLGHDLPVFCDRQTEDRIRRAFDYAFDPAVRAFEAGGVPRLELRPIRSEPFDVLGARVIPIRLRHGRFDVLGFRIGDVAYCTDTNEIPAESWPLLEGLDVLVLDCLRPKPHATHFSFDQAIEVAGRLAPRRTLFTHIAHGLKHAETSERLPPGMELAHDGLRVPLVDSPGDMGLD